MSLGKNHSNDPIVLVFVHPSGRPQSCPCFDGIENVHIRFATSETIFIDLVSDFKEAKLAVVLVGLSPCNGDIDDIVVAARDKNPGLPIIVRYPADDSRMRVGVKPYVERDNIFHLKEGSENGVIQRLLAVEPHG